MADAVYSNGFNYKFLEQRRITGWIPVFGMYKPEIAGFPYNKEKDDYSCPMNKPLPFTEFHTNKDGTVLKNYYAASKDCKVCPMKSTCVPKKGGQKPLQAFFKAMIGTLRRPLLAFSAKPVNQYQFS
jgi:hypothetical protein